MSRRKQAKPRAVFKSSDADEEIANLHNQQQTNNNGGTKTLHFEEDEEDSGSDTMGTDGSVSWNSETADEDQNSLSASSSCDILPGDDPDNITFTIGPTESTPYACQGCEKCFPRLSYLKKHEQSHSDLLPFKCSYCQRLFKHKRSRDRHVKLHTGDKKYRCPHCESAFSRSDHLKIHLKTHDHQKPYQCVVCNRGYNTAAALTSHMQNHKKESISSTTPSPGQFRCLQCNGTFSTGEDLQSHVTLSHSTPTKVATTTPLKTPSCSPSSSPSTSSSRVDIMRLMTKLACIYCAKDSFTSMEALQLHVQALHGPVVNGSVNSITNTDESCNFCTMKFVDLGALHKHIIQVHNNNLFLQAKAKENAFCASCSIAFHSTAEYAEHYLLFHKSIQDPPQQNPTDLSKKSLSSSSSGSPPPIIHSVGPTPAKKMKQESLLCNQCDAGFQDFESFRSHLKTHLILEKVEQKFICDQCESEFVSEEQLESHSMVHYLNNQTEYGCQSCIKLFSKPDELQKHLLDIHAHHLYRCALCKEVFDSKVSIQVHFAVKHSNECKLFRCSHCSNNNIFRSELEFQMHVRLIHLRKLSPYRCLLCNSSFGSELELQYHLNSHQKQFQCKLCDEAFHVEFLLDKHLQTHQLNNGGMMKEKCDACEKTFETLSDLSLHKKIHHHNQSSNNNTGGENDNNNKKSVKQVNSRSLSLNCAYCNENCKSRSDLENHMKSHQTIGKNKCNICDEICPTSTLLAEHKLTHCKVISGNKCTGCKLDISNQEQYLQHMKQHNNNNSNSSSDYPLPCIICRQTLMTEIELQMHCRFHTESTNNSSGGGGSVCLLCLSVDNTRSSPFICTNCFISKNNKNIITNASATNNKTYQLQCIKCQMSFSSEEEIQSHVNTHLQNEGANHECHLCSLNFDTPLKLQCHLIEHTFEGCSTFTCYMCSSVFTNVITLQQHMIEHGLQTRPYDCNLCHLKFFFRAELDNHLVIHGKVMSGNGNSVESNNNNTNNTNNKKKNTTTTNNKKKFFYRSDSDDDV